MPPPSHRQMHPHTGGVQANDYRHGFIALHPFDAAQTGNAQAALANAAAGDPVAVNAVTDLVVVLVDDPNRGPGNQPKNRNDFHLFLGQLAARYLALPNPAGGFWFSFERHF